MFIAALLIIAKKWKQSDFTTRFQKWKQISPPTDEGINILGQVHTTEFYSVIKRKQQLIQKNMVGSQRHYVEPKKTVHTE